MNRDIFETIYFAACEASCELAKSYGAYSTYQGSPASQGRLQYDLWGVTPSDRWDWAGLKARIAAHGMRNSLGSAVGRGGWLFLNLIILTIAGPRRS